jgi:hypothetical protein
MINIIIKILKNSFIKKNFKNSLAIYAFLLGAFSGISYMDFNKKNWYSQDVDLQSVNVCFSPPSGCGDLIAREISTAKDEIYLQAYGLTSKKNYRPINPGAQKRC